MLVMLDASSLVPLQVPRDQHVRRTQIVMTDLLRRRAEFLTTNWTFYEALTVASRSGHAHARALFARVSAVAEAVPVSEPVEREALRRFLNWSDKTASVVDHANLLVAVEERCDAILSFDEDFAPSSARQASSSSASFTPAPAPPARHPLSRQGDGESTWGGTTVRPVGSCGCSGVGSTGSRVG
jgi:predicted nucleic acid-binding protein